MDAFFTALLQLISTGSAEGISFGSSAPGAP